MIICPIVNVGTNNFEKARQGKFYFDFKKYKFRTNKAFLY